MVSSLRRAITGRSPNELIPRCKMKSSGDGSARTGGVRVWLMTGSRSARSTPKSSRTFYGRMAQPNTTKPREDTTPERLNKASQDAATNIFGDGEDSGAGEDGEKRPASDVTKDV